MRRRKKNRKKVFIIVLSILLVVVVLFGATMIANYLSHFFPKFNSSKNEKILSPIDSTGSTSLSRAIADKNIKITNLEIATDSGILNGKIVNGPLVYFSQSENVDIQASTLQLILSRLTIDAKKPILIDLRFKKPIVKF